MTGRQVRARIREGWQRQGFLLPAVLLLICLIVLLAVTRFYFSREHLNMAAHLADYERAYHVANGALLAGRDMWFRLEAWFNQSDPGSFPKRDKAPPELKKVFELLLGQDGLPPPVGASFLWEDPLLAELSAGQYQTGVPEVEIELRPAGPLFAPSTDPGIRCDPREAQYHLFINAKVTVGEATCHLTWYRATKLINILPPVLGKFSLFLREQGSLKPDRLEDSNALADLRDSPLVIRNGFALAGSPLAPTEARDRLDRDGWVFLGGGTRWSLGLSAGGGDGRFADGLVPQGYYLYPLAPEESLSRKGKFSYFSSPLPLHRQLRGKPWKYALERFPGAGSDFSSVLHLNGSGGNPAGTLVVGNVVRRWALVQGLIHERSGMDCPFPYLDAASYQSDDWPFGVTAGTIGLFRDNFGSYEGYEKRMSNVVEEPYNAGLYRIMAFPGDPLANTLVIDPERLPAGFVPPPPSRRLKIDGQAARLGNLGFGSSYTLLDDAGQELFSAGDPGALADLSFLERRVIDRFPDLAVMRKALPKDPSGALILPGVILFEKPLVIDEPLRFLHGGMILVRGGIRIQSEVTMVGSPEPLTLVSLGNDIKVETAATVEAGLVALQGRVEIPREAEIRGFLAARELALAPGNPPAVRQVRYDGRFDPTSRENWQRQFRLLGVGQEVFLVR